MHHVHTDGDTVLREKDHAHPVSPRDTDLAHFISTVKFNASDLLTPLLMLLEWHN